MARKTFRETMEDLSLLIRAGYPVIYVVSHEESRVLDCLARIHAVILSSQPRKKLFRWDQGKGLREIQGIDPAPAPQPPSDWLSVPSMPAPSRELPRGNAKASEALDAVRTAPSYPEMGCHLRNALPAARAPKQVRGAAGTAPTAQETHGTCRVSLARGLCDGPQSPQAQ